MDVVSRFLLASFQGNILEYPSKIHVHLLGSFEGPSLLSVSRNDFDLLTEPTITAWLAKEFHDPQFTEFGETVNLGYFRDKIVVFLDSTGDPYEVILPKINHDLSNTIFAIGAQEDIPPDLALDISTISKKAMFLSLGSTEYLASQTATILRYLITRYSQKT